MELFFQGLDILLQWQNFIVIPIGLALGIVVGAIPGLTSDLGIILCIPLTYGMEPTMAILMLLAIYCGGTYGGSITAILINTPGTSANAATLFDGYPLAKKGEAYKALSMALFASTIGGLLSAFALLFFAPQIAKITLLFGPAEYLALAVFGLSVIAGVSNKSIFKGLIGACIGIFMSTIGMDNISGTTRFTFGNINLMSGIDLIIALIGLFAISEIMMKSQYNPKTIVRTSASPPSPKTRLPATNIAAAANPSRSARLSASSSVQLPARAAVWRRSSPIIRPSSPPSTPKPSVRAKSRASQLPNGQQRRVRRDYDSHAHAGRSR